MTNNVLASVYTIYFYDHTGTAVLLLDDYEYLEYTQRVDDAWNHIIRLNVSPEDTNLTFFRSTLVRDFILNIYRVDPSTGQRDLVYEGFHRTLVDQMKQDGSVVLTMYGVGYTQLLKRRVIVPAVGDENSVKSGVAETVIKDFVDEQAVNPTDTDRDITGLTNQTDLAVGGTAEYSARYTNLYTAVSRLAEQGSVDFGVVGGSTVGTFELRVVELWGTDRRIGNADGNVPTIFDVELHNMLIPILSRRGSNEVNHVYVGGQGQGTARTIQEEQNATAIAISPWNRHESFVDARNEANADGLTTRGQAYLSENAAIEELTFEIEQTDGTRWLRDWELGDIVSARYGGLSFTKKIVQVHVVVSAGETGQAKIETISPEMEDV